MGKVHVVGLEHALDLGRVGVIRLIIIIVDLIRGARKLTGENLKVVWAKFLTLS